MPSRSYIAVNNIISSTIELLKQTWSLLARKDSQNRRLLSQLDDFDQDLIFGNTASERQENIVISEDTTDRNLTVGNSSINTAIYESMVNVKILERRFNERIDREKRNIVDTVEDNIQNAILAAIDNIVAPEIELAIRSINASSGGTWLVWLRTQNAGTL